MNEKTIFLLDSYGLIYRCYYAMISRPLTNSRGENISAVYGFFRNLLAVLHSERPKFGAAALDSITPTFRHEKFAEYKATRKPTPPDLKAQFPIIEEILAALRIPTVRVNGFEADDVLATLACEAKKEGFECKILTGDKDLLQLVGGGTTVLVPDKTAGWAELQEPDVIEKWGVRPCQIRDFLALVGDSVDNVPGVAGIGAKGAVKLLQEFGSLEKIYESLEKISGSTGKKLAAGRDAAFFSYDLVGLSKNAPFDARMQNFRNDIDFAAAAALFEKYEMPSLAKKFLAEEKGAEKAPKQEAAKSAATQKPLSFFEGDEKIAFNFKFSDEKIEGFSLANSECEANFCGENLDFLQKIFENPQKTVCLFDSKPVFKALWRKNIKISCKIRDEKIAWWLFASDLSEYSLQKAKNYFSTEEFGDARTIFALDSLLAEKLAESQMTRIFEDLEMPLVPVLARMEIEGIKIEKSVLAKKGEELRCDIAALQGEIFEAAGHEFNIASPKQLQAVLFDEQKLPAQKKTKTGYSTDESVLQELAETSEFPAKILQFRAKSKLLSTYVEALPKLADERGRIHTDFVQTGTATGRLSSREPNLQNIPVRDDEGREIRRAFAAGEGKVLISADYSQIELVILAHLSGDDELRREFLSGEDVHKLTAAKIFGVPLAEVSPVQRRVAKTINFGVMYGMSAFRLAKELKIPRSQAQEFIKSYFSSYAKIGGFIEKTVSDAEKRLFVQTILGRRRPIAQILSANKMIAQAARRIAVNSPIQGSAADIVKRAMLRLSSRFEGGGCKMLLQVHDELIFECDEMKADSCAEIIRREMESAADLAVPLKVSVEIGKTWGEFH